MQPDVAPALKTVALSPAQSSIVRAIIERVIPGARVQVFGSRATGRSRPFSDLDLLVLQPACLSWSQRADLRDLFEASELPFRVDVVEADALSQGMVERIVGECVPLSEL